MPRALRMSSAWTIVSPSQVSAGPGGCLTEVSTTSKLASVSAGESPGCAAAPFSCSLSKLNPKAASLPKNAGGVIEAVEVIWATMSRTVHWPHNDRLAQSSLLRARRSDARALRSAWMVGQIFVVPMSPPLGGGAPACPYCSVEAKLATDRTSRNRIVGSGRRQGAGHPEGPGGADLARPSGNPRPDLGPGAVSGGDRRGLPGDQADDLSPPRRPARGRPGRAHPRRPFTPL